MELKSNRLEGGLSSTVLSAYRAAMTELKFRLRAIEHSIDGKLLLESVFVREFCYLQLRMSCELLALSCVIAHDNLTEKEAKKLLKEYHAGKIMSVLEKLHPDFFPRHVNISFNIAPGHHEIVDVDQEGITRDRLVYLYNKCGAALHRGSTIAFMTNKRSTIEKSYLDIRGELAKFRRLLDGCAIRSACGSYALICGIGWNNDDPAEVKYAVAKPYPGVWPNLSDLNSQG